MHWKEKVYILEKNDDFDVAIFFMQQIVENNPDDVDAYIFLLFRLMYSIIEHSCHFANVSQTPVSDIKKQYYDEKEGYYEDLLLTYFAKGYEKFSENAEFLFYTAEIACISNAMSDIYMGLDGESINKMMDKAALLDPENPVFKLRYYSAISKKNPNDPELLLYKQSIFDETSLLRQEFKKKGLLGEYLLGLMKYWSQHMTSGTYT